MVRSSTAPCEVLNVATRPKEALTGQKMPRCLFDILWPVGPLFVGPLLHEHAEIRLRTHADWQMRSQTTDETSHSIIHGAARVMHFCRTTWPLARRTNINPRAVDVPSSTKIKDQRTTADSHFFKLRWCKKSHAGIWSTTIESNKVAIFAFKTPIRYDTIRHW